MIVMLGNIKMTTEETLNLINEKINDPKIKEYLTKINKFHYLDFDTELLGGIGGVFSRETYVLMMQLGIPIGVLEYLDSKGKIIPENTEVDLDEKVKHIYTPINSIEDLKVCYEKYRFHDFIVNLRCITKNQARHLAYCLEQCNNDLIFDMDTRNAIQQEILSFLPLKYDKAMKIFNKYFNKGIQMKYIKDYGVSRDRFYELSGLNELVPKNKSSITNERSEK